MPVNLKTAIFLIPTIIMVAWLMFISGCRGFPSCGSVKDPVTGRPTKLCTCQSEDYKDRDLALDCCVKNPDPELNVCPPPGPMMHGSSQVAVVLFEVRAVGQAFGGTIDSCQPFEIVVQYRNIGNATSSGPTGELKIRIREDTSEFGVDPKSLYDVTVDAPKWQSLAPGQFSERLTTKFDGRKPASEEPSHSTFDTTLSGLEIGGEVGHKVFQIGLFGSQCK
jgi:hypothetical protein